MHQRSFPSCIHLIVCGGRSGIISGDGHRTMGCRSPQGTCRGFNWLWSRWPTYRFWPLRRGRFPCSGRLFLRLFLPPAVHTHGRLGTLWPTGHAYYSPSLVRRGVLTPTHLRSLDNVPGCVPPTWEPRYWTELAPASFAGEFTQELVSDWGTTSTLRVLMTAASVQERVPEEMLGYFNSLRLQGPVQDFLRSALWRKLPVDDRIAVWVRNARCCPLCGGVETHDHAVSACPNLRLMPALISQLLPRPKVGGIPRLRLIWC